MHYLSSHFLETMIYFKRFFFVLLLANTTSAFSQENCVYVADDIYPGSFGSLPTNITQFGSALYFSAAGNSSGTELWKFENGTSTMVMDINPGPGSSLPTNFLVSGSYLYFAASNGLNGKELWRFDGVSATMVADIFIGASSSMPDNLTMIGSTLYFTANNGSNGIELWKYDGTVASIVSDIFPGMPPSNPSEITEFEGDVYFVADNGVNGVELWKYDGSTVTMIDINVGAAGSFPGELIVYNGLLCFRANDGVTGTELWYYDGSAATLVDINPTGNSNPYELTIFGSELVFRAFNLSAGTELWKYDGIVPTMIANIYPGATNSFPSNLTVMDGNLYFAANNGTVGVELFKYDGTSVTMAADIYPGASPSMPVNPVERFVVMDSRLYLVATNNISGNELFSFDGTTLTLGRDIMTGVGTSSPTEMIPFGSILYFMADNGSIGGELWAWNPNADLDTSITVVTCGFYTSPAGDLYDTDGVYNFVDAIPSILCPGCDSLITVDLTINEPFSSITVTTCQDYTTPGGVTYSTVGDYLITEVIPSIACPGADSTITIDLSILAGVSPAVVVFSGVLVSQQAGASYQWLDCNNGYLPIAGETDQDFLPSSTGTYACEISITGCVDTTACYDIVINGGGGIGITEENKYFSVQPNPVSDKINVKLSGYSEGELWILDCLGNIVKYAKLESDSESLDVENLPAGIYMVRMNFDGMHVVQKIVKL